MDCSLQSFSVHGIFQARLLEWVAISFSRRSSWPRDRTQVSSIAGRCFTIWATREAHDSVTTNLEPGILECEVKWALGNITKNKASGGDGIPDERFQILKHDAVKVLYSICQQIWEKKKKKKTVATGLQVVSFHPNPKERQWQRMLRLPHNCTHLTG